MNEKLAVWLYNQGYQSGHHDTVEGMFTDVLPVDMDSYHDDVVADLLAERDQTRHNHEMSSKDKDILDKALRNSVATVGEGRCITCDEPCSQCTCARYELAK